MTFDKQSNHHRTAVKSKSNRSDPPYWYYWCTEYKYVRQCRAISERNHCRFRHISRRPQRCRL